MGFSYLWSDIKTFVAPFVQNIPTSSLDVVAADRVSRIMWRAAPFRWTLASLTAITLTDATQDFALSNTDMYYLVRGRLTNTSVTPNESVALDIVEWLEPALNFTQGMYYIQACSMIATTTTVRLDTAISVPSGTTIKFQGEYQTNPTKIAAMSTTINFDDNYVDVGIEGMKWAYMVLAKDPRAGGATVNSSGQKVYQGQYGILFEAFDYMKKAEDFGSGAPARFPGDALGVGRATSSNLFGWG